MNIIRETMLNNSRNIKTTLLNNTLDLLAQASEDQADPGWCVDVLKIRKLPLDKKEEWIKKLLDDTVHYSLASDFCVSALNSCLDIVRELSIEIQ